MSCARYFNPRLRRRILFGDVPEWLKKHPRKSYIIACVLASVEWGNRRAIQILREEARSKTLDTGIRHVLDHEIPLNHPYVCGLHIADNLRVVREGVNKFKSNKWSPDQMSLDL